MRLSILAFCLSLCLAYSTGLQARIEPVADAWTFSSSPYTNYGNDTELTAFQSYSFIWMKFDLSSLPQDVTISTVTVEMTTSAGAGCTFEMLLVLNDSWTEYGITPDNAPAVEAFGFASGSANEVLSQDVSFPVIPYIQNYTLYFDFMLEAGGAEACHFYSRQAENVTVRPNLVVDYESSVIDLYVAPHGSYESLCEITDPCVLGTAMINTDLDLNIYFFPGEYIIGEDPFLLYRSIAMQALNGSVVIKHDALNEFGLFYHSGQFPRPHTTFSCTNITFENITAPIVVIQDVPDSINVIFDTCTFDGVNVTGAIQVNPVTSFSFVNSIVKNSGSNLIQLGNASSISIRSSTFSSINSTMPLIRLSNYTTLEITNTTFVNSTFSDILQYETPFGYANDTSLSDVHVINNTVSGEGLSIYGNLTASSVEFLNNKLLPGSSLLSVYASTNANINGLTFRNNYASDLTANNFQGTQFFGTTLLDTPITFHIQNAEFSNGQNLIALSGKSNSGFSWPGTFEMDTCVVQDNTHSLAPSVRLDNFKLELYDTRFSTNKLIGNMSSSAGAGSVISANGTANVYVQNAIMQCNGVPIMSNVSMPNAPVWTFPPCFTNPLPTTVAATSGLPFKFRFNANTFAYLKDPNFYPQSPAPTWYEASTTPFAPWLSFNNSTRTFSGLVPPSNNTQTIVVTITAYDSTLYPQFPASSSFNIVISPLAVNKTVVVPSNSSYLLTIPSGINFSYNITNTACRTSILNGDPVTFTYANGFPAPSWLSINKTAFMRGASTEVGIYTLVLTTPASCNATFILTVTNLTMVVATSYNATVKKYIPLPPITLKTDQPQVTVTFSVANQKAILYVQEPYPDNVTVGYNDVNTTVAIAGQSPVVAGMLSNGAVQYNPSSAGQSTEIVITADDNQNPITSTDVTLTQTIVTPPPDVPPSPVEKQSSSGGLSQTVVIIIAVVVSVAGVIVIVAAIGGVYGYKKLKAANTKKEFIPMKLSGVPEVSGVVVQNRLGGGNFGEVYKGAWNGAVVALKKFKDQESYQEFEKEANVLHQLTHPHIVQFLGTFNDEKETYIVTEFMSLGNVLDLLKKDTDISAKDLLYMAKQAASGMAYLASKKIVHRDLAARNLLVKTSTTTEYKYEVKVADFGLSRIINDDKQYYKNKQANIPVKWSAPESLKFGKFSTASDVWSFGIVLFEIFSRGTTPYVGMSNQETAEKVISGYRMPKPDECPQEIYELMLRCWDANPDNRPSFGDILASITSLTGPTKAEKDIEPPIMDNVQNPTYQLTESERDVDKAYQSVNMYGLAVSHQVPNTNSEERYSSFDNYNKEERKEVKLEVRDIEIKEESTKYENTAATVQEYKPDV